MEIAFKTVNKKIHFRYVTGSEFASDYISFFVEQQNSYITFFWSGDSY